MSTQPWKITAALLACFITGLAFPGQATRSQANSSSQLARLNNVAKVLSSQALTSVTAVDLWDGASRGVVEALADPYSVFLNVEQYQALESQKRGEAVGIGVELAYREGQAVVVSVLPNTPAQRNGLKAGDRLLAVAGVSLADLSWAEINARLQGQVGESLLLRWQSTLASSTQPVVREARFVRENLRLEATRLTSYEGGRCLLHIQTFLSESLVEEAQQHVQDTGADCEQGMVLDLRNNPGGLVGQAVDLAGLFGVEGTVFQLQSRDGKLTPIQATPTDEVWDFPLVVLIDQGSASASELLAAALRESGRAVLMGETSFGKGLVQSLFPLYEGRGLSLTTARYLTRLGNPVHEVGVAPDVVIQTEANAQTATEPDIAVQIALDYLR